MRIRRLIVAATLTLLAALAVASPASAEPGNGAHVVNESNCYNFPIGTYCQDLHWVINDTETPSGNLSHVENTRSDNDFTLAGCHDSVSSRSNQHYLMKDGELHELSSRNRAEFSNNCYGNNYDCHSDRHVHYANGEVQFSRREFECNQP